MSTLAEEDGNNIKVEKSTVDGTNQLLQFGDEVVDEDFVVELRERLFFGLLSRTGRNIQFPGSQPVSFTRHHLQTLEAEDYYVCEKSDGIRYLLYYACPYGKATAFLIDRNFVLREIPGLTLPARAENAIHEDTLLDGELIYEEDPEGKETNHLLFLVFDALLINGRNIMGSSLPDRLKCVQNDVIAPFKRENLEPNYPFRLDMKKMWKPYAIAEILEMEIPKLHHGNDGLIFTPVKDPYVSGTCERLLKWKPSEMNSVDFLLRIDPVADPNERYQLLVGTRDGGNCLFAFHPLDARLDELDGKVIECRYNIREETWEFLRTRPDKLVGNNERVAEKIIGSIKDNVTAAELIARIPAIKKAWKAREAKALAHVGKSQHDTNEHPWKRPRMT